MKMNSVNRTPKLSDNFGAEYRLSRDGKRTSNVSENSNWPTGSATLSESARP